MSSRGESRPVVVAIVAAYNERDIIGQTIAALVGEGVSVYFIDNHSTDDTVAAVRAFEGRGVIGIETYPPQPADSDQFDWRGLLERKEALAQSIDADWFIHHDADEFRESPWTGVDLRSGIEIVDRLGYNAIDFELFNFALTRPGLANGADVRTALLYYEDPPAFSKVQIRAWRKNAVRIDLHSTGGHEARFVNRRVFPLRFILRHYPLRNAEQALRKIHRERLPRFKAGERAQGWHVQYNDQTVAPPFERAAEGLKHWDGARIREGLWLRHRLLEDALKGADLLQTLQRLDSLEALSADLQAALKTSQAQLEESTRRLENVERELERQFAEAAVAIQRLHNEKAALQSSANHHQQAAQSLVRRVSELESSWSWRLMAPARVLAHWLRLR